MKKGWKSHLLGEICSIKSGGTPSKRNPAYWGGDIAWISAKDMKCKTLTKSIDGLTQLGFERSKKAKAGDLLVLVRGMTLHKDVPICIVGKDLSFNQDVKALTPVKGVDTDFLFYALSVKKDVLLKSVDSAGHGTGRLDTRHLTNLKIDVPSFAEQRKIAQVLSTWDEAIEKTEKLISQKEKMFNGLVQYFAPRTENVNYENVRFEEVFEPEKVLNNQQKDLELLSVTTEGVVLQSDYFNKDVAAKDKSSYLIVKRGRLVMSGLNFWMGSIDFQNILDEGLVSPAYKVFKLRAKNVDPDYMRFFVRSPTMTKTLINSSVQGASIVRRNLDMKLLNSSILTIPSYERQRQISSVLLTAEAEIKLLKRLVTLYRQQKQGLMKKLLMVEWMVKNKEVAA